VSRSGTRPEPECWEPVITRPDPVPLEEWLAWDPDEEDEPPGFCEDDLDPEGSGLPWDEDLAAIVAETDQIMAGRAADAAFLARAETAELAGAVLADEARRRGPRGPGLPGSAERVPGVSSGPAGGFGSGGLLDAAAGSAALHGFVERAVGNGARLAEASDDEVIGLLTAADRVEASACYLKHAAAAELLRRRPAPGSAALEDAGRMPEAYLDSASAEVKWALAETRQAADGISSLAWDLEVKLPGTRALFRDGRLRHAKVVIIARETAVLDAAEARQAEEQVLGQAPGLSPGQRSATPSSGRSSGSPPRKRRTAASTARRTPGSNAGRKTRGTPGWRSGRRPRPGCWLPTGGSPGGPGSSAPPGSRAGWTCCAPAPPWTCCWTRTPARPPSAAPPRLIPARITPPGRTGPPDQAAGRSRPGSRAGIT
jgi:hypothetical protein